MAGPLYPSLIPRYVDECWLSNSPPAEELDAQEWLPDTPYQNVEVTAHQPIDIDDNEDDDDDEMNEDDEEDGEDIDDDELDDDYLNNSPTNMQ